jgi:hypothetical protein
MHEHFCYFLWGSAPQKEAERGQLREFWGFEPRGGDVPRLGIVRDFR